GMGADGEELDDRPRRRRGRHDQQLSARDVHHGPRRIAFGVEPGPKRGFEGVDGCERRQPPLHLRGVEVRDRHRSTKPGPRSSRGSSTNRCSPVLKAVPSTSVITPSGTRPTTDARNDVPRIESLRQLFPSSSSPWSTSSAVRAEVAEPVGERSTSPSAKTTTLRWCAGPTSSWITVP